MRRLLPLISLFFLLAACGTPATPPTAASVATAIPTPEISPTPAKPVAVLIVPVDTSDLLKKTYEKTIYDLAQGEGYRFQVFNTLTPAELDPAAKIVIAVTADPGLAALAASAPQAQFLAVNIPGVTAGGNISVVGGSNQGSDIAPYLAGYIASMLAQDYRIGMIAEAESEGSANAAAVFANARTYYCGLCQPVAPPWYEYPIVSEIPLDTSEDKLPFFADVLRDRSVLVAYVYPSMSKPSLLKYIASTGILMVGEVTPPDNVRSAWVASIQPDWLSAIQQAWPQLVAGKGGQTLPSPLILSDVNPDLLSDAKLRLVQQMLSELIAGTIGTKP